MCAKGGQGPARALKQSHNHRTASADGHKCWYGPFSCFSPLSNTGQKLKSKIKTTRLFVRRFGCPATQLEHVSALSHEQKRTRQLLPRTKEDHIVDRGTKSGQQRAPRELRRTTSLVRRPRDVRHPSSRLGANLPAKSTDRTNSDPIAPRRSSRCSDFP